MLRALYNLSRKRGKKAANAVTLMPRHYPLHLFHPAASRFLVPRAPLQIRAKSSATSGSKANSSVKFAPISKDQVQIILKDRKLTVANIKSFRGQSLQGIFLDLFNKAAQSSREDDIRLEILVELAKKENEGRFEMPDISDYPNYPGIVDPAVATWMLDQVVKVTPSALKKVVQDATNKAPVNVPVVVTKDYNDLLGEFGTLLESISKILYSAENVKTFNIVIPKEIDTSKTASFYKTINTELTMLLVNGIKGGQIKVDKFIELFGDIHLHGSKNVEKNYTLFRLKKGILNCFANVSQKEAVSNFVAFLNCLNDDLLTPENIKYYLVTLETKPENAFAILDNLYKKSITTEQEIIAAEKKLPTVVKETEAKSQVWHWEKYGVYVKYGSVILFLLLLAATQGVASMEDVKRKSESIKWEIDRGPHGKYAQELYEIQVAKEYIQEQLPSIESIPVLEKVREKYIENTAHIRRRQHPLYRAWNAFFPPKKANTNTTTKEHMGGKRSKRITRRLRRR